MNYQLRINILYSYIVYIGLKNSEIKSYFFYLQYFPSLFWYFLCEGSDKDSLITRRDYKELIILYTRRPNYSIIQ